LKVLVKTGQTVAADTDVMTIRSVTPGAVSPEGVPAADVVKTITVDAGAVGAISAIPVIAGQTVAIGDVVAQVAPASFTVSGPLQPEQQYRLLAMPTEAQVTVTGGPAPFTCTGVTITSALAGAAADPLDPTAAPTSGATVSCPVPPGVTVFAGLAAELTLSAGIAENVLTVPVTAVEGLSGTGNVYAVLEDGSTESRPVVLGLTDGVNVEVKEGLAEGDTILQFVPGAEQDLGEGVDIGGGCLSYSDGSVVCEG
jgi:macrolide-specific efflux system membrane fusion protein